MGCGCCKQSEENLNTPCTKPSNNNLNNSSNINYLNSSLQIKSELEKEEKKEILIIKNFQEKTSEKNIFEIAKEQDMDLERLKQLQNDLEKQIISIQEREKEMQLKTKEEKLKKLEEERIKNLENLDPYSDSSIKAIEEINSKICILEEQKQSFFSEYKKYQGKGDSINSAIQFKNQWSEQAKIALSNAFLNDSYIENLESEIIHIKNNDIEIFFASTMEKINQIKKIQENKKKNIINISKEENKMDGKLGEKISNQENSDTSNVNTRSIVDEIKNNILIIKGQINKMDKIYHRLYREMYNIEGSTWKNKASLLSKESSYKIQTLNETLEKEILQIQKNELEIIYLKNLEIIKSFSSIQSKFNHNKKSIQMTIVNQNNKKEIESQKNSIHRQDSQTIEGNDLINQMMQDIITQNETFRINEFQFMDEFKRLGGVFSKGNLYTCQEVKGNIAALQAFENAKQMDSYVDSIEYEIMNFRKGTIKEFITAIHEKINLFKSSQHKELNVFKKKSIYRPPISKEEDKKEFIQDNLYEINQNLKTLKTGCFLNDISSLFCKQIELDIKKLNEQKALLRKEADRFQKHFNSFSSKNKNQINCLKAYSESVMAIVEIEISAEAFQIEIVNISQIEFDLIYFKDLDKINSLKNSQQIALDWLLNAFEDNQITTAFNKEKKEEIILIDKNKTQNDQKDNNKNNENNENNTKNYHNNNLNINDEQKENFEKAKQFIDYYNDSVNQGIRDVTNDIDIFRKRENDLLNDIENYGGKIEKSGNINGPPIAKRIHECHLTIKNYIKNCEIEILKIKQNENDRLVAIVI